MKGSAGNGSTVTGGLIGSHISERLSKVGLKFKL